MKFEDVRAQALSLPEVTEEPHFGQVSFRVRGKIFITAPAEGKHVHLFVEEQEQTWANNAPKRLVADGVTGCRA